MEVLCTGSTPINHIPPLFLFTELKGTSRGVGYHDFCFCQYFGLLEQGKIHWADGFPGDERATTSNSNNDIWYFFVPE